MCPRCSTRSGRRISRRIFQWLSAAPHEELWTYCLTQRVVEGESILDAKKRMVAAEREFDRTLRRAGIVSMASTVHLVWSAREHGWHYHVHKMIEAPAGVLSRELMHGIWDRLHDGDTEPMSEENGRKVADPGPALLELASDDGDLLFWREAETELSKAIQYPVRDMCQGVSAWRFGHDEDEQFASVVALVKDAKGMRMQKLWGRWTKKAPPPPAPVAPPEQKKEEGEQEKQAAPPGKERMILGTVNQVVRACFL